MRTKPVGSPHLTTERQAKLEYRSHRPKRTAGRKVPGRSRARTGEEARWGFRFRSADGATVLRSPLTYASRAEAEQGFLAMVKSIAANQYVIDDVAENVSGPNAKN